MIRLADPRRPTGGPCVICDAPAEVWRRSERRDTDADGLTLAIRACSAHESEALRSLGALTLSDVVEAIPRRMRARRADTAERRAARLGAYATAARRASASLSGASSAAHTYGLLGGYRAFCGEALLRLATALRESLE